MHSMTDIVFNFCHNRQKKLWRILLKYLDIGLTLLAGIIKTIHKLFCQRFWKKEIYLRIRDSHTIMEIAFQYDKKLIHFS